MAIYIIIILKDEWEKSQSRAEFQPLLLFLQWHHR